MDYVLKNVVDKSTIKLDTSITVGVVIKDKREDLGEDANKAIEETTKLYDKYISLIGKEIEVMYKIMNIRIMMIEEKKSTVLFHLSSSKKNIYTVSSIALDTQLGLAPDPTAGTAEEEAEATTAGTDPTAGTADEEAEATTEASAPVLPDIPTTEPVLPDIPTTEPVLPPADAPPPAPADAALPPLLSTLSSNPRTQSAIQRVKESRTRTRTAELEQQ